MPLFCSDFAFDEVELESQNRKPCARLVCGICRSVYRAHGEIAQLARAHGSYPWCQEFESLSRYLGKDICFADVLFLCDKPPSLRRYSFPYSHGCGIMKVTISQETDYVRN